MPDTLENIVKKMIDAGEKEETIGNFVQEYQKRQGPSKPQKITEPTTFAGGVLKSIASGDAPLAGLKGLGGFAYGAIADLPRTAWEGAKDAAGLMSFGNPQKQVDTVQRIYEGLKGLPGHVSETFSQAGSHPFEFGRMMGQFTGQPLVGEGIGAAIPKIPAAAARVGETLSPVARAAGGPIEALGDAGIAASPFVPWGFRLKTAGVGFGLKKLGERLGNVGSGSDAAMAADVDKFWGGPKPPPATPVEPTVNTNNPPGPFDRVPVSPAELSEADMLGDIEKFYGGPKPPLFPPTGDISINSELGPFDKTPLTTLDLSDAEAIRQFRGPQNPPVAPASPTINTGPGDPFSRTPLPQSMFRAGAEDLHTQSQLKNIGEASQTPLEGDPFSPENVAAMESENPPIIDDTGGTSWEELPPSGVPETPIDPAKLQEFANQLHAQTNEALPLASDEQINAAIRKAGNPVIEPEVVEGPPRGPVAAEDPEWIAKQKAIADDTARMQRERENRPHNQEQVNETERWKRMQRNFAKWEGRNINDVQTPLTPEQTRIARSYQRIEAIKRKFSEWFAEQEAKLPEEEFYKVPDEIQNAHDAKISEMWKQHEALVERLVGPLEKEPPPIIDIQ